MPESRVLPLQPLADRASAESSAAPEVGIALLGAAGMAGLLLLAGGGSPRPASATGIVLGALGLLLMIGGSAGYAWRKRRSGPWSLQGWLRLHVVSGLLGPALILLHSGFAFRGLAGAATVLMLAVAATGALGRFAYPLATRGRPALSAWWLLHVSSAYALYVAAVIHAAAALVFTLPH